MRRHGNRPAIFQRVSVSLCVLLASSLVLAVGLSTVAPVWAAKIEAIPGKNYKLTKQHGPWMVMVASFRDVQDERRQDGLTAREAADKLVHELRELGVPAYTFEQEGFTEKIERVDRLGRVNEGVYAAQRGMVSVLAGNYNDLEDKTAQKTLKSIKRLTPKFMEDKKSGAIFRVTPGRPGPLAGAFMTINPLLSPEEVARRKVDQEVLQLNSGLEYPLIASKKNYTLKVATFTGRTMVPGQRMSDEQAASEFDRRLKASGQVSLNEAGEDAMWLAKTLRERGYEAYVYHDRYQSIVTIGATDSPDDPAFAKAVQNFGAKRTIDPQTQREVEVGEAITLTDHKKKNGPPLKVWVLDAYPEVMKIPRVR